MFKKILCLAILFKISFCLAEGNINIWATVHNNSHIPIWFTSEKQSRILINPGQSSNEIWVTGHHYNSFYTEAHLWEGNEGNTRFCNNIYNLDSDFVSIVENHDYRAFEWSSFDHENIAESSNFYPTSDPYYGGYKTYFSSVTEYDGALRCTFTSDDNARIVGGSDIDVHSSINVTDQ